MYTHLIDEEGDIQVLPCGIGGDGLPYIQEGHIPFECPCGAKELYDEEDDQYTVIHNYIQ